MNPSKEHIDRLIEEKLANRDFGTPPEAFLKDLDKRMGKTSNGWTIFLIFLNVVFILLLLLSKCVDTKQLYNKTSVKLITQQIDDTATYTTQTKVKNAAVKRQQITNEDAKENNAIAPSDKQNSSTKMVRSTKNSNLTFTLPLKKLSYSSKNHKKNAKNDITNEKGTRILNRKEGTKENTLPPVSSTEITTDFATISNDLSEIKKNLNTPEFFTVHFLDQPESKHPEIAKKLSNDASNMKPKQKKEKKKTKSDKISIELQLYGGVSGNLIGLSGTSNASYFKTLSKRIQNPINPYIGIHANIIYKNWLMGTGVSYITNREKNDYSTKIFTHYDSVYVSGTTIDSVYSVFDSTTNQWDSVYVTSPVYDSLNVTHSTKNQHTIRQQYAWIQIPLRFGYRFTIGKWSLVPSIGANIAIGIKNNNLVYPTTDYYHTQQFSALRLHFNLMGNLEVRYNINQWHIFLGMGYQYALDPYLKTDHFALKYNQINGVLGIGYQF